LHGSQSFCVIGGLMVNRRPASLSRKDFGSHPATGITVDAGLVYVEVTVYVFGATLGEVGHGEDELAI
jgi:hypothetical protein